MIFEYIVNELLLIVGSFEFCKTLDDLKNKKHIGIPANNITEHINIPTPNNLSNAIIITIEAAKHIETNKELLRVII